MEICSPPYYSSDQILSFHKCQLRWLRKFSGQEHPAPIFKCSPSRKLSCSILLDLLPGCLFINSIGCDINLMNPANSDACFIESNNIAVPFELLVSRFVTMMFGSNNMKLRPFFPNYRTHFQSLSNSITMSRLRVTSI